MERQQVHVRGYENRIIAQIMCQLNAGTECARNLREVAAVPPVVLHEHNVRLEYGHMY